MRSIPPDRGRDVVARFEGSRALDNTGRRMAGADGGRIDRGEARIRHDQPASRPSRRHPPHESCAVVAAHLGQLLRPGVIPGDAALLPLITFCNGGEVLAARYAASKRFRSLKSRQPARSWFAE